MARSRSVVTQGAITTVLKAAANAGLSPVGFSVRPDGTVDVRTSEAEQLTNGSPSHPWDKEFGDASS